MKSRALLACAGLLLAGIIVSSAVAAQTPAGTWELYPPQGVGYSTLVQQPINADGTSNFKDSGKAVIHLHPTIVWA